jgi:hypothetical protein
MFSKFTDVDPTNNLAERDLRRLVLWRKKSYGTRSDRGKYVATMYAELEWLHPWIGGQGRTDLVLLNYLLRQEGLNPVILEDPYFSTFHPIVDWIAYLERGIEGWKEEFQNFHRQNPLKKS